MKETRRKRIRKHLS